MFPNSKYSKWYMNIVENACSKNRNKQNSYFENHHIFPKCMGGNNKKSNLVLLTAKEHFICHLLLVKIFPLGAKERHKLLHAFMLMKGENSSQIRYMNSNLYNHIKEEYAFYISKKYKGRKMSEEQKQKISQTLKSSYNSGKRVFSEETKQKISIKASTRKRKRFSKEARENISKAMKKYHQNKNKLTGARLA